MTGPVRVVVVPESPGVGEQLAADRPFTVEEHPPTAPLDDGSLVGVDAVVVGHDLPGTDAWTLVDRVSQLTEAPVLVYTAAGSERLAGDVVAAGAAGYVPADAPESLATLAGRLGDVVDTDRNRRTLERYRTLVERVPDPMYVLDDGGFIELANAAMERLLGEPREDLLGTHIGQYMRDEDLERGQETIEALLKDDGSDHGRYELVFDDEDGEPRTFHNSVSVLREDGRFVGSAGVIRDITERKRREGELQQYETIINTIPDPVYALDPEGRVTFANDALLELSGYSLEKAQESGMFLGMRPEDIEQARDVIRTLLSDETGAATDTFEMQLVTKAGRTVPIENHIGLLPFDEEFRGTAGIMRDISERKRRKRQLEVLNTVLRHNLRNDLNVVLSHAEFIESTATDPAVTEAATAIQRQAVQVTEKSDTIRDVEEVVERAQLAREGVDAAALVERLVATYDNTYPELDVAVETPGPAPVAADSALMTALGHLLENAVEHCDHDDPAVTVSVDCDVTVDLGVAGNHRDAGQRVAISVADNGPGIPEHERELLASDDDITPLKHGSGLGLWVASWIVESYGGEFRIDDNEPTGTVVTLYLHPADA